MTGTGKNASFLRDMCLQVLLTSDLVEIERPADIKQ